MLKIVSILAQELPEITQLNQEEEEEEEGDTQATYSPPTVPEIEHQVAKETNVRVLHIDCERKSEDHVTRSPGNKHTREPLLLHLHVPTPRSLQAGGTNYSTSEECTKSCISLDFG